MTTTLDRADAQGLIVRGYGKLGHASFLLFGIEDAAGARAVLRRWADQAATAAAPPGGSAVNIAVTAAGLRVLGVPGRIVDGFGACYAEGMVTEHRTRLLGDQGAADPRRWAWGGPAGAAVHLLLLVYASTATVLKRRITQLTRDTGALSLVATLPTDRLTPTEPFGFRDGLSQPALAGTGGDAGGREVPLGEFVLGYPNAYGRFTERPLLAPGDDPANLLPRDPGGSGSPDLGRNGSFLVLRQLSQDVDGFWSYVRDNSDSAQSAERLAAKMVGRWPSGAPLVLAPERDAPDLADQDFAYHETDPQGLACPIGAHVRRANPRDSLDPRPGSAASLAVNDRHRLLRRGRSYTMPAHADGVPAERGLHFLCLNANLSRQYEFVQHTWVNAPTFAGLHDDADPLVAPRNGRGGTFTEQGLPVRKRHRSVPAFVQVRGGAYFFLPGLAALRYLSTVSP